MSYLSAEPRAQWLGSWRFWLVWVAALVLTAALLGARTRQLQSRIANPVEVHLYGQAQLVPGQSAAFRVFVADGKNEQPISGAEVRVALIDEKGGRIELGSGRTDETGVLLIKQPLRADLPEGAYRLEALASSPLGEAQAEHAITIKRGFRILLTSDKPLYQPGQTIHMRALAIDTSDGKPAAARELVFEVQDSKGNKVGKQKMMTSQFGIAAVDFALADQVNTGDYGLSVYFGGTSARRSVTVKTYVLPKFRVELTTDRASYQPGGILQGELKAIYTFGQPIAGARVRITGSDFIERYHEFTTIEGTTDAAGRYLFSVPVPALLVGQPLVRGDALIKLEATVTAAAGGVQQKSLEVIVAKEPLRIEAVAESGELQRGVPNRIYLVVSTLEGEPLLAKLAVGGVPGDKAPRELATSRLGVAEIEVTPEANGQELVLEVSATLPTGQRAEVTRKLPIGARSDGLLLRPEHAVYHTADTLHLNVLSSGQAGRVFLDVVKDQRTVMMHAIDMKDGRGSLTFDLPPDLTGTLELSAYALHPSGEIVRDVRLIQVYAKDELEVSLRPEKPSYAPGDSAVIDISVSRRDGTGVPAALGIVGVDEAVYALYDTRPGLEQLYFTLQEELLKPRYELHAHLPPPVFGESRGAEVDEAQTVLLSAATERAATEAWPGTRFVDRQREYDQATQAWFRMLTAAGFLSPIGIFALLFLCAFGFAVSRLFQDNPIQWESLSSTDDIEGVQRDLNELTRTTGGLMSGWFVGLILPPIFGVLGQLIGELVSVSWREREQAAIGGVLLAVLIVTTLLFRSAITTRRSAIGSQRPLFRKIVLTVPFAYLFGALGCVLSLGAAQQRIIEGVVAALGCLSAIGLAIVYFGVLSIVRQTALRPVGLIGWLWLLVTRPLVFAIPGALFLGAVLLAKQAPGVIREERFTLMPTGMSPAGESSGTKPTDGKESAELLQPTRVRRHFPETLLWRPEVITDGSGKTRLEIPLADSITTWRLAATAVTASGELGGQTIGLRVFQDFFVDLEMPATLTQHDELDVPVSVFNYLDAAQQVKLDIDVGQTHGLEVMGLRSQTLTIGAKQTTSVAFRVRALFPGRHTLTVRAAGSALADAVERPVTVLPDGQPVTQTINGRLEPQVVQEIVIPDAAIDGGSDLYLKIYPGSFSQIVEGLDGIFRMPSGCFEQTSSTTYPSVLALDYLRRSKQTKPDLELKALKYIGLGYQRLLSFEVPGGGFEWFGNAPAHNLLTAYGLLEFRDMSRVYEVDPALIERTRRWLWQQNKDGRFTPTSGGIAEGAINQYRDSTLRATAYITWALVEPDKQKSGQAGIDLERSLDYIYTDKGESDAYTLALRAQALLAADRTGQARKLLDQLETLAVMDSEKEPNKDPNRDSSKDPDKDLIHFTSKSEGMTHSFGNSMDVETTGLAAQAMLQGGGHQETAHRALRWLTSKRDSNGTWGSTQATIAAMRALLAGTEGGGVKGEVTVTLRANETAIPAVRITPDTSDVYRLISLRPQVHKGKNTITLSRTGEGDLAYQIVAVHHVPWQHAQKSEKSAEPMNIAIKYDATTVRKDALLGVHVSVRWNQPGAAPMTLVDLGIPPGFELLSEDLDKLIDAKQIERYSNTGRQLIVYLSAVAHDKPVTFDYRLRARYSVHAKTPASRAYPYYQPEAGAKADPVEIVIK